jgi:hypothetical protein
VIVIIAGRQDDAARWLVGQWKAYEARLLTPRDLSIAGWRHQPHPGRDHVAVVDGRAVPGVEIDGVLTRLGYVPEHELMHVVEHDRAYVAAEMTALLSSWLTGLGCPVLNRPTPTSLSGPAWRREQWVYSAARLGIPVCPVHRHARRTVGTDGKDSSHSGNFVAVVAGDCFGAPDRSVADHARQLASAAGVDLLAAHFTRVEGTYKLAGADLWPDVTLPGVADAILDCLSGGREPGFGHFGKGMPAGPTKPVSKIRTMPNVRRSRKG